MPLRPTGHRVLIRPDAPPDVTETGLLLPQERDHVPVSGTVVALGPGGSLIRYQARQRAFRDAVEIVESTVRRCGSSSALLLVRDELAGLIGTSDPTHEFAVGDRVTWPPDAGLSLVEDGVAYVLLNEDEVVVIATPDEVSEPEAVPV